MGLRTLVLSEVSTNCYIYTDDKSGEGIVVDPGEFTEELKRAVETDMKSLKYILLTHGHFDHILGVYKLKEMTGAKIAIHEKDAECLFDEVKSMAIHGRDKQINVKADILLRDGDKIEVGEVCFCVVHTPGHTKGSVCYVEENGKFMFSGDTLFRSTVGRTDFPGGDITEMLDSVKRLSEYPDDCEVFPGHNISTTIGREKLRNRYMRRSF